MITRERARELRAVIESAVSAYGLDDAAAVAVAAVLQAHSDVRAASPRRPVRIVWQSVRNSRR